MAGLRAIGVIMGIVGIVFGVLVGFGTIPALQAVAQPSCAVGALGGGQGCVTADLSVQSQSGLSVTVTDSSSISGSATGISNVIYFGDASKNVATAAPDALGTPHLVTHTYAAAGTYSIQETAAAEIPQANQVGKIKTDYTQISSMITLTVVVPKGVPAPHPAFVLRPNITYENLAYQAQTYLSVKITDGSIVANLTSVTASIQWGDGATSAITIGGSVDHTYSDSGNYTVTETVSGTWDSKVETKTATTVVGLVPPPVNCKSGCNRTVNANGTQSRGSSNTTVPSSHAPPSEFVLGYASSILILGFAGVLIFSAVPGSIGWRVAGTVAFFVLGAAVGYFHPGFVA